MKKVLITGANGLLGQKLIQLAKNFQIKELIATGRGPYRGLSQKGFRYIDLDISNEEAVKRIILEERPDAVIHAAAMTNVDACETQKEEAWTLNVESVRFLKEACEKIGAHLVHVSTDFIFDGKEGPYSEEGIPAPLSYYGQTKRESEKIVQSFKGDWTILRTALVYGVTPGMSRSNIVLWALQALTNKKEVTVVTDQFRSPTLAEDLATGCLLAVEKKATGIFNISGQEQMNIFELVSRVAEFFKLDKDLIKPGTSDKLNQAAVRPPITGFIIDKARKVLGYKPHSFEEGLALVREQLEGD